ncbi:coatomer subunit beta [Rozella allomycis CSF55]|uniref:Coatomer subunit beta' n=1 Tax=Rozella allomycis (strain CSF55) TaxID=988480 RepID=A0A4P9YGR6_ROZAC|nr:coatomer subunit beta [Rozella allomycis CSF55]
MGLRLDIKKLLSQRSSRVKSVEFHPTEPWILAGMYNGQVMIIDYNTSNVIKTFEVTDAPVRAVRWITRKNWIVIGSDDMLIRIINYNTYEKVATMEGHTDYLRCLAVHAEKPFILSSSDDMTVRLWDWEKGFKSIMTFEGHTHYVMSVVFSPKDGNIFATASLDKTIKVWSLNSSVPNFTLEGHSKGVNSVEFYHGGDKPYLVIERTVKVWDYQNKCCLQTLSAHSNNVSAVCFHPDLPLIISAGEDGTIRMWNSGTFRLENTLNYSFERGWSLCYLKGMNVMGFGYDEGTVVIKIGKEEPTMSMDSSGKIVWAKNNEIMSANVKNVEEIKDGERLNLNVKEMGNSEVYAQNLQHSPNGRFVVVCGDGEYTIYTSLAWRNKSYGTALEFVWSLDSNEYAIRESTSIVKIFKSFKEKEILKIPFSAEGLFGGVLLGVKSSNFLCFYDWETCKLIRRIDITAKNVYWSDNNELLAIVSEESFYVLKLNVEEYKLKIDSEISEDGIEESFEFICEVNESVKTGCWNGDCFIFTTNSNKLAYAVGNEVSTISMFDSPFFILGYVAKDARLYLADKDLNLISYSLSLNIISFKSFVLRNELNSAFSLLSSISQSDKNILAHFLEKQGLKEKALEISNDEEHCFNLSIQLNKLQVAFELAEKDPSNDSKWRQLADAALSDWNFELAEKALWKSNDFSTLLILYQASGDSNGLLRLATTAEELNQDNIAFNAYFLTHNHDKIINLLVKSQRFSEAVIYSQSYCPLKLSLVFSKWKSSLPKKIANRIMDPQSNPDQFPHLQTSLNAESWINSQRFSTLSGHHLQNYQSILNSDIHQAAASNTFPSISTVKFSSNVSVQRYQDDLKSTDGRSDNMSLEVNTTGTRDDFLEDLDMENMKLEDINEDNDDF